MIEAILMAEVVIKSFSYYQSSHLWVSSGKRKPNPQEVGLGEDLQDYSDRVEIITTPIRGENQGFTDMLIKVRCIP